MALLGFVFYRAGIGYLARRSVVQKTSTPSIPTSIVTPDRYTTSIGELSFTDGAPSRATAQKVYDYLDTMRGVDAFLKGIPAVSLKYLIKVNHKW